MQLVYTTGFATISFIEFYFRFSFLLTIIIFLVYHLCTTPLVSCLILFIFHCTYPLDLITPRFILIPGYHSLFDISFMSGVLCLWHSFQCMSFNLDLLIHVCLFLHATWHSPHHSLKSFWLSLDPHVQIPEFWACGFSQLLIIMAQQKRGSSADRLRPHPSRPPWSALEFSLCDSWVLFVQFMIVYHFVFMHHVYSYSDSCLYWCLADIHEDIFDLHIYVAVTSLYPRNRGVTRYKKKNT